MASLTDTAETETLKWLVGQPATAPVLPLSARLMSALGTDATAGTEVSGGSYAPQDITVDPVTADSASNANELLYSNMPTVTVVGVEVWDSAAVRWWHGALTTPRDVVAGEPVRFPVGTLVLKLA